MQLWLSSLGFPGHAIDSYVSTATKHTTPSNHHVFDFLAITTNKATAMKERERKKEKNINPPKTLSQILITALSQQPNTQNNINVY